MKANAHSDVCMLLTLGAQVMCTPGTGRVVMYIVTQRYKYRVPMRKKNRLHAIDLQMDNVRARIEQGVSWLCHVTYEVANIYFNEQSFGDSCSADKIDFY